MGKCEKCEYRTCLGGFGYSEEHGYGCDYLGLTGHRRPCKPGKGCTEYKPFTGKYAGVVRDGQPEVKRRGFVAESAMPFYKQGLNDAQIAKSVGCRPEAVRRWRVKNKLPPNQPRSACKIDWNAVTNLYLQGFTGKQIADAVHCSDSSIKLWRSTNGHRANRRRVME